jgi:hypothetical protein
MLPDPLYKFYYERIDIMKKLFTLLLTLALIITCFSGCGGKNNSKKDRDISPQGSSDSSQAGKTDLNQDSTNDEEVFDEGTIASLDEIKNKLIDSGYEISDLIDLQKEFAVNFVDGFNFSKDGKKSFVMEFATPKDSKAYADMVIESGYNIPILNGRFVTLVEATKGIVTDLELQAELEELMDAKALVPEQWSNTEDVATNTTDYRGAYDLMQNITKSMNTILDQALAKNNNEHPEGDPQSTHNVFPFVFGSIPIALTSQFCEDEAILTSVESVAGMMGLSDAKAIRNRAHDYTMTAIKTRSQEPYEINAVYDPTSGGLRMVEKTDGKVTEFFEFIPLGSDQYAFQRNAERGIVNYKNGAILSFVYTKNNSKDGEYNSESDSIYPSGAGANIEWVTSEGEDGYEQYFYFDGKNIKLSVDAFGKRVKTEIPS